jgi:glucokinase
MSQSKVILAYDFGGTKVGIALVDTSRTILKRSRIQSVRVSSSDLLSQVIEEGKRLLGSVGNCELIAVGIGICGVVFSDHIEVVPNLSGAEDLDIRQIIADAFHVPAVMENDVKAATLAELRQGNLNGTDYGLYINFGTGISAGFTVGDHVMRGHNGAAGEIAYLTQNRQDPDTFKSGHASFEEFASGSGISRRFLEDHGQNLTAKEIFEVSKLNPEAKDLVSEACDEIGHQVANLATMWNPERIVIGGGMSADYDIIHDAITAKLEECVAYPPTVVRSHYLQDASLYGAIELAFSACT